MKTAKLGVLFIAAIFAITALGAAYAHWEETLEISGIMTTDDIDPQFECAESNDDPDEAIADRLDPKGCGSWVDGSWLGARRDKDVGSLEVFIPADGKEVKIVYFNKVF